MARKTSAFVEGLNSGMEMGLKIRKIREDKAMKEEMGNLEKGAKPTQGFLVTGPDGRSQTYTDEKMADKARAELGEGATMDAKFFVAGKPFDNQDEAMNAAEQMNSPAAKLRQQSEIALKYNRPDLAEAYNNNYKNQMAANRSEMVNEFNKARLTGDTSSIEQMYNERLPNGTTAKLVRDNETGAVTMELYKGKTLYTKQPFESTEALFQKLEPMIAAAPDNMVEMMKMRQGLDQKAIENKQGDRRLDQGDAQLGLQGLQVGAQVRKTDAEIAQMPEEMALKSRQVGAAETSAGASAVNAQTGRMGLTMPKAFSGVNETGEVMYGATGFTPNRSGGYDMTVLPAQVIPGMKPVRTGAAPSGLDAFLMNPGGAPKPLTVDWSKVPAKNTGGAVPPQTTPLPPGGMRASGTVPTLSADEIRRQQLVNQIPR